MKKIYFHLIGIKTHFWEILGKNLFRKKTETSKNIMRGFKIAEFFVGWSTWFYRNFAAKLCILRIVSGFRNNDAPFVLLLVFLFFDRSDKFLTFTRFLTFTTDTKLCVYPMHSLASYWTRRSFGSSMSIRLSLQYMLPAEVQLFLVGFFFQNSSWAR